MPFKSPQFLRSAVLRNSLRGGVGFRASFNVDGAVNCFTLYGRCRVACSRCYLDYPTQAKLRLPRREAQRAFRIAARYHPALRQIEILDEAAFREWDDTWYPPQPMISTAVH